MSADYPEEFKDAIGSIVREITKRDVDNAIKADSKAPKLEQSSDIKVNIVTKAEASASTEVKKADQKKVESQKQKPSNSSNLSTIVSNLAKKQESSAKSDKLEKKEELTKSIPSGTTITVKQVPVGSSRSSPDPGQQQSKEKKLTSEGSW